MVAPPKLLLPGLVGPWMHSVLNDAFAGLAQIGTCAVGPLLAILIHVGETEFETI